MFLEGEHLAGEVIKEFEMSMAIFAPGWVYETLDKKEFCSKSKQVSTLCLTF